MPAASARRKKLPGLWPRQRTGRTRSTHVMDIAQQLIFIVCAALIVASALMFVTTRNLVHAALWLIAAPFGVAGVFFVAPIRFLACRAGLGCFDLHSRCCHFCVLVSLQQSAWHCTLC